MQETRLIARLEAKPEFLNDLQPLFITLVQETHKELGCIQYDLHKDKNNPLVYFFIERWVSEAAFNSHLASPHFTHFGQQTTDKIVSLEITMLDQVL